MLYDLNIKGWRFQIWTNWHLNRLVGGWDLGFIRIFKSDSTYATLSKSKLKE
jgi:hypothetical protein